MRILLVSDLHMEFPRMGSHLLPPLPDPETYDVVVAAGDISYDIQGIKWLERFFPQDKPILFVPGNHEYYTKDFQQVSDMINAYDGRVKVLNPDIITINDYTFIGATLWSDLQLKGYVDLAPHLVKRAIADFKWGFTPEQMLQLNVGQTAFIHRALEMERDIDNLDKTVVITHFVPTQLCISEKWKHSQLNPYFTNDNDWLMNEFKPAAWLFGHTHDRFDIIHPSGTRVVGNPYGYVGETPNFDWKIIEV